MRFRLRINPNIVSGNKPLDSGKIRPVIARRRFMQALASVSALSTAAMAQAPPSSGSEEQQQGVTTTLHDVAGATVRRYFSDDQFAALQRISDLLAPNEEGRPGALDVEVPEFLDYHVSVSFDDRQQVYRAGLDALNHQALLLFDKSFADLSDDQADRIIAGPIRVNWTPSLPKDALAAFLREARQDVLAATQNSRDYSEALASAGIRRRDTDLYWYVME